MTHILIPIANMEQRIKNLRQASVPEYRAIANSYELLMMESKQISLDEEDIDKLAYIVYPNDGDSFNTLKEEGYKQALKDLK